MAGHVKLRCRQIGSSDVEGVADLLARGFPARSRGYWAKGLARLADRAVPDGYPRFGYMLDNDGAPVGALLTITQMISHDGPPAARCNLSSWYVEPAFRSHAALLCRMPLRFAGTTYLNISPAPNTWPTIEADGFQRYTFGQRLTLPILHRSAPGLRIVPYTPDATAGMPEARLLADHAATGCLVLIGQAPEGPVPFVFLPMRAKQGRFWFPGVQLIFCRALADVARFAGPLGRRLAWRGTPFLIFDADATSDGPPGFLVKDRARKYVKGGAPPRLGDLAYTEFTIFGP